MNQPKKRHRGQGRLFRRGPTWWIAYYVIGREVRESAETNNVKKADELLDQKLAAAVTGTWRAPELDRLPFSDLLADLETHYRINRRRSKGADSIRAHLRDYFGHWPAARITTGEIRRYCEQRLKAKAAPASINRELQALRRAFGLAQAAGKVRQIPLVEKLKEAPPRRGFVEHTEYLRFRELLPDYVRPVYTMGYYTGMRLSEIVRIRWSQVDLAERLVRLESGETKNDTARVVPLTGELLETIKMQRTLCDAQCPECSWVFFHTLKRHRARNVDPERPPLLSFKRAWATACTAAKADARLFHDLRRTGVRNLIRAGVPEKVAMLISGHKTRSVLERYNIVDERDLKEAGRCLELYITRKAEEAEKEATDALARQNSEVQSDRPN